MASRINLWALAAIAATALVQPVWAGDEVDKLLYRQSQKLFDLIDSKKASTVGVLKFRAQKATERETFNAGPINNIMAERLESVLIAGRANLDQETRIIRDASNTAAQAGQRLNYLNAADRPKLFGMKYKDVEKKECTPDLFFTGVVKLDQKAHQTTVVIEAFDKNANTIEEVARFTTPNEKSTLNDFGQAYVLARRNLINRPELDGAIAADLQGGFESKRDLPVTRSPDKLADLRMLLNNQLVPFEDDPSSASSGMLKFTCREPLETDTVQFVIENTSNSRVACVLKVNGESTLFRERDAAQSCRKWILEPGKSVKIGGFYDGEAGRNMRKFIVKAQADPDEPLSPSMQGTIDFHVFVEDKEAPPVKEVESVPVTRGLSRDLSSYGELNKSLMRQPSKLSRRGVILGGAAEQGHSLQTLEFANPKEQAHWFIRYMPKKD